MTDDVVIDLRDAEAVGAVITDPDRLAEIRDTGLLDAAGNSSLDRVTRLAERLLDVPLALINIVDRDRQVFASEVGLRDDLRAAGEVPLTHSFCQYAVAARAPFVVPDARAHPVVKDSPAIVDHAVVAYVGQPLETSGGHVIGSLCVAEPSPREWTQDEVDLLGELAALALSEIEYRLRAKSLKDLNRLVDDLAGRTAELGDAVRRLADRTERAEDPVVGRLATAARARMGTVEHGVEALTEAGRWRGQRVSHLHRSVLFGERISQACVAAMIAVPDRSIDSDVRDRPLRISCDGFLLERALTNLLVGVMQQAPATEVVGVQTCKEDDLAVLTISAGGAPLPVAELTRLVGQLRDAVVDRVDARGHASLEAQGGGVRIEHGPVTAATGVEGTTLQLRVPVKPEP